MMRLHTQNRYISLLYIISIMMLIVLYFVPYTNAQPTDSSITSDTIENLALVTTLEGDSRDLTLSQDGQILGVIERNEGITDAIRLWDTTTLQETHVIQLPSIAITTFTFHPDGQSLFIGTSTGLVMIWHIDNNEPIAEWQAHDFAISLLEVHPDDNILVTGNHTNADHAGVMIWWDLETPSPTELHRYSPTLGGAPSEGLFFSDENWFVAGIGSRTYVWDGLVEEPSDTLTGQLFITTDMVYLPHTQQLAITSDMRITLWDMTRLINDAPYYYQAVITNTDNVTPYVVTTIATSADNQLLFTGDSQGDLKIWDSQNLDLQRTISVSNVLIDSVRVSEDTVFILPVGPIEGIQVWRIAD